MLILFQLKILFGALFTNYMFGTATMSPQNLQNALKTKTNHSGSRRRIRMSNKTLTKKNSRKTEEKRLFDKKMEKAERNYEEIHKRILPFLKNRKMEINSTTGKWHST